MHIVTDGICSKAIRIYFECEREERSEIGRTQIHIGQWIKKYASPRVPCRKPDILRVIDNKSGIPKGPEENYYRSPEQIIRIKIQEPGDFLTHTASSKKRDYPAAGPAPALYW